MKNQCSECRGNGYIVVKRSTHYKTVNTCCKCGGDGNVPVHSKIDKILPTQEEVDELLNDDEVIEQTAEEIMEMVFDRR